MNFERNLDLVLETLPDWQYMRKRAFRNRPTDQTGQTTIDIPKQQVPEKKPSVTYFPPGTKKKYENAKQEILRSIGQILPILPHLKDEVTEAVDFLFHNVTIYITNEEVGERWEILQREWLNILKNIEFMLDLIPVLKQYAGLRNSIRTFRDRLRASIGKAIFNKPSGPSPQSFAKQPSVSPSQRGYSKRIVSEPQG